MVVRTRTAVALTAGLLILVPQRSFCEASLRGDRIVITGEHNTLATVARDIADPAIFAFDPERSAALANRNLLIQGTLLIGSEAVPEDFLRHSEILEMNISRCGAVRIEVAASGGEAGELHLRRAKLVAIHETDDECSDPNLLVVQGKLLAHDSEISGNIGCDVKEGALVDLVGTTISYTRDSALTCDSMDEGQRLVIRDSAFIDNANYGIRIGRARRPLEIRDSVFRGLAADVCNAGGAEVVLRDCDFRSVKFGSLSGRIRRTWSVAVETPGPGLHVEARSAEGNPQREVVRGVSDENGLCQLALTEYVAFPPRAREFLEGVNNVTPHVISVYGRDGKTLLYKMENFHVFMKDQRVRFP